MNEIFEGGCYCGDVRFEVANIFDAGYCHCSICRRFGGGPVTFWANAPAESFRITRGDPACFASSENWERYFCPRCGTGLFGKYRQPPAEGRNLVSFGVFNLLAPQSIRPTAHMWCSSKVAYFETSDDLPRFPEGALSHPDKRKSWRAV
jgi:hypothetical protein